MFSEFCRELRTSNKFGTTWLDKRLTAKKCTKWSETNNNQIILKEVQANGRRRNINCVRIKTKRRKPRGETSIVCASDTFVCTQNKTLHMQLAFQRRNLTKKVKSNSFCAHHTCVRNVIFVCTNHMFVRATWSALGIWLVVIPEFPNSSNVSNSCRFRHTERRWRRAKTFKSWGSTNVASTSKEINGGLYFFQRRKLICLATKGPSHHLFPHLLCPKGLVRSPEPCTLCYCTDVTYYEDLNKSVQFFYYFS